MRVYNFSHNSSYSNLNSVSRRHKGGSSFSFIKDIFNTQNSFAFQILGVLVLTMAVFLGTQGIFSGTSVALKAQNTDSKETTKVITNFDTKSPQGSAGDSVSLKEIVSN